MPEFCESTLLGASMSNQQLQRMLETSQEFALFELDTAGNFVSWNLAGSDLLKLASGNPVTQTKIQDWLKDSAFQQMPQQWLSATPSYWQGQLELKLSALSCIHCQAYFYPSQGQQAGGLLICQLEKPPAAESPLGFWALMGHELRSPLNVIVGFTGALLMKLSGPLSEAQQSQLNAIKGSARQLLRLINDLVDLSKIETGRFKLDYETIELTELLQETYYSLEASALKKGLSFQLELPVENLSLQSDYRCLNQILLNLLNNAIKYTEQGQVSLRVKRLESQHQLVFEVEDTGVGIALEDQPDLFQIFEQLGDNSLEYQGIRLGLHLSKKLAALIGAELAFESKPETGSIFRVHLPLAAQAQAEL